MKENKEKMEEVFSFFQERCLWQFYSRAWDRKDNINGVCGDVIKLLTGERVELETPEDKCHYADSRILADELKKRCPWLLEMEDSERKAIIEDARDKLMALAVTNCRNPEIHNENY